MRPTKELSPNDARAYALAITVREPAPYWDLVFELMSEFANKHIDKLVERRNELEDALREIQAIPYNDYADSESGREIADIVSAALKPQVK